MRGGMEAQGEAEGLRPPSCLFSVSSAHGKQLELHGDPDWERDAMDPNLTTTGSTLSSGLAHSYTAVRTKTRVLLCYPLMK